MMPRKKRKPEELIGASKHLKYEVTMMIHAAQWLPNKVIAEKGHFVFLECFVLHARSLIDFLFPRKRSRDRENDVFAEDYFASHNEWEGIRGPVVPFLEETRSRADSWLAHLSYKRLREKVDPEWKVGDIANSILDLVLVFERGVDKKFLAGSILPTGAAHLPRGLTGSTKSIESVNTSSVRSNIYYGKVE